MARKIKETIAKLIEDDDGSLYFILPKRLSDKLDWMVGDKIKFILKGNDLELINITKATNGNSLTRSKKIGSGVPKAEREAFKEWFAKKYPKFDKPFKGVKIREME